MADEKIISTSGLSAFTDELKTKLPMVGATNDTDGRWGVVPTPKAGEDTYVLSGAGQWIPPNSGPVGPTGPTGSVGPTGAMGPTGATGSSSVLIWNNDDDIEHQGKLWLYDDGKMSLDFDDEYNGFEIYYSHKGSDEIQYYKIASSMILAPKTNKGMFYTFNVDSVSASLFSVEQCTVEYLYQLDMAHPTLIITSKSGNKSEVKIEQIYGLSTVGNGSVRLV